MKIFIHPQTSMAPYEIWEWLSNFSPHFIMDHICNYLIRCTPDISLSCISRNWIYCGRMLEPIFWRPRARYFSRNRGNSLHAIRGRQFFVKSAHRDSLCPRSKETVLREINSSIPVDRAAYRYTIRSSHPGINTTQYQSRISKWHTTNDTLNRYLFERKVTII